VAERLYRLQSAESYGFLAGTTSDGDQIIIGKDLCSIVAIRFDARGKLKSFEERPFDRSGNRVPALIEEVPFVLEPGAAVRITRILDDWKRELGILEGTISVEEFSIPNHSIGIEELPSHHVDFLEDPESDEWTDEDRERLPRAITEWRAKGNFIFFWNEDYWMNPDGSVGSS
jgi:hypothetical protein